MKTLYFDTNHIDLVGGGGLALYNLSVALQEYFDVHLATPWNDGMAKYEFLRPPPRPWQIGRPAKIDVFVASRYAEFVAPEGQVNVFYCLYPKYGWPMLGYQKILTLSEYSRQAIREYWRRESEIVVGGAFAPYYASAAEKQNNFLSCARFFMEGNPEMLVGHSKGQHHLIRAFQKANLTTWSLTLTGSVLSRDDERYLEALRKLAAADERIIFCPMATREELQDLYSTSRTFLHGMGYGYRDPAEVEHYGIVVEKALLSGCYSIVHNSGGVPELANANWETIDQLVELMKWCATMPVNHEKIVREAAERFTWERFVKKVGETFHAYA